MIQNFPTNQDKIRVAVLFGGQSTEHEISIITALQVLDAFDSTRFETIPVYIDETGKWYTGEELRKRDFYIPTLETKKKLCRVRIETDAGIELVETESVRGWFGRKPPRRFPVDIFFPAFHGSLGEDGCIQGYLEFIGAPYTGSGVRAASVGMNKHAAKQAVCAYGVPVLPDVMIHRREWSPEKADESSKKIIETIPLPVMVKPCNLGSSIGISAAYDEESLMISLAGAFAFDYQVVIEPLLEDMYELNIAVRDGDAVKLSAIERPKREAPLLTFEEKYLKGNKKLSSSRSSGMAAMPRDIDPPDVPEAIKTQVQSFAARAYSGLECAGVVRIDFLIDRRTDQVYFNEINLLPGSFAYFLWEKAAPKINFTELLTEMVTQTLEQWRIKKNVRRTIEKKIFK